MRQCFGVGLEVEIHKNCEKEIDLLPTDVQIELLLKGIKLTMPKVRVVRTVGKQVYEIGTCFSKKVSTNTF